MKKPGRTDEKPRLVDNGAWEIKLVNENAALTKKVEELQRLLEAKVRGNFTGTLLATHVDIVKEKNAEIITLKAEIQELKDTEATHIINALKDHFKELKAEKERLEKGYANKAWDLAASSPFHSVVTRNGKMVVKCSAIDEVRRLEAEKEKIEKDVADFSGQIAPAFRQGKEQGIDIGNRKLAAIRDGVEKLKTEWSVYHALDHRDVWGQSNDIVCDNAQEATLNKVLALPGLKGGKK